MRRILRFGVSVVVLAVTVPEHESALRRILSGVD